MNAAFRRIAECSSSVASRLPPVMFALIISLPAPAQTVDDLVFLTEEYPPLNFEREGKLQGIAVEAIVEMLSLVGSKTGVRDIKLVPWARGYKLALEEKNTALFAMTRTEARERMFKWVGPIIPSNIVLVAKRDKDVTIDAVEEINRRKLKVVAVRDDIGEQILLESGVERDRIHVSNLGAISARMLQRDRVDMWAYGQIVAFWIIKELGFHAQNYEVVLTLQESAQYFAFHKDTDDAVIADLQAALDELKASGKLEEIVSRYIR